MNGKVPLSEKGSKTEMLVLLAWFVQQNNRVSVHFFVLELRRGGNEVRGIARDCMSFVCVFRTGPSWELCRVFLEPVRAFVGTFSLFYRVFLMFTRCYFLLVSRPFQ
jgi:hypothetical protein